MSTTHLQVEWEGDGIVALCAKTYYTWKHEGGSKISSKGLSKRTNNFNEADFKEVLHNKVRGRGRNVGFKIFRDKLYQYEQERAGLSYLYIKRVVQDDGVTTRALHL
jgi:hypothetical protein